MKYIPDKIGSYDEQDVKFLLRDISHLNVEVSTKEREEKIQTGVAHYSEMLPVEFHPDITYMSLYEQMLLQYGNKTAQCVAIIAEKIVALRGIENLVLVSLARAGTPIGILIKRYLSESYAIDIPHYSISIIRGGGIDQAALHYIEEQHPRANVQFVDGWTGKGAITKELQQAVTIWNKTSKNPLDADLAVLADPGHCVKIYGTREDFLIPSACLNSTVSGLVSRTVFNSAFMDADDFHGAKFYKELADVDVSNTYIDSIVSYYSQDFIQSMKNLVQNCPTEEEPTWRGLTSVNDIQERFGIKNHHHIKPGIGETTRVLLRRIPWKILVNPATEQNLSHIYLLAKERGVEVEEYSDMTYSCCGLIKELS